MGLTSYIAASRQATLQNSLDVTALNIASQAVPGHQNVNLVFSEYVNNGVSYANDPVQVRDQSQGPLVQTQDPLHLAISGTGYFAVQDQNGVVGYTRGGAFHLNKDRFVVTPQGDYVLDDGLSPLKIPETSTDISVSESGIIADQQDQIGKVGLFTFDKLNDMMQASSGYLMTDQDPQIVEFPQITQGAYEGSNTNMIMAVTQLATLQREYQHNMQFIKIENELESQSNQRLMKLAPTS